MADHSSRRRCLATTGAIGATALAGCLGGGGGDGTPAETAMDDDLADSMTETTTESIEDDDMTETMSEEWMMGTEFTVTVENVSTAETR